MFKQTKICIRTGTV